jgi:hypothetical protein
MMAKEEENGDEADTTERACQKCQQIDQKKARAIDKCALTKSMLNTVNNWRFLQIAECFSPQFLLAFVPSIGSTT